MAKKSKKMEEEFLFNEEDAELEKDCDCYDGFKYDDDTYDDDMEFGDGFESYVSGFNYDGINVVTVRSCDGEVMNVEMKTDEELEKEDDDERPLASYIDSTILKADATKDQIIALCQEAKQYHFASVCVNSCWVRLCSELLEGSGVNVCTVVGFPLGAMASEAKAYEATLACENGASEIDMVINVGALKSKDYKAVASDINCVCRAAHEGGAILKVIIETCLLTREEKIIVCLLAQSVGADFVKTSTGFSTAGATEEDVKLMSDAVDGSLGVKAAGGIRSKETAEKMIQAGATRIGTSSGAKICGD